MDVHDVNTKSWTRSSFCGPPHNCVELSRTDSNVMIRDSKNAAAILAFDHGSWSAFTQHCRAEF